MVDVPVRLVESCIWKFLGMVINNNGITMMRIWIFNWRAINPAIGFIEIPEITESKKWQPLYRELYL